MGKLIDLTGQRFGKLVVLNKTESKNNKVYWHCKCDCGNECNVVGGNLKTGNTFSCGCFKKEKISKEKTKDLSNQKFGKLTVISYAGNNGKQSLWNCKCDCGNTCVAPGPLLTFGSIQSCGCQHSRKESEIAQFLTKEKINFSKQKTFETCRFLDTNRLAYFDFYLQDYNILIEFDGSQHFSYRENGGWNNKQNYLKTIERDSFKNKWAKDNNIPLLRIKYNDGNYQSLILNFIKENT